MSEPARTPRMTAEEFIEWSMKQPEGQRYELVDGEVVGMASERALHARIKFRIARRLAEAVEQAGLPCTVFPDGMAVEVDADTVYEPDAMVHCGTPVPDDAVLLADPMTLPPMCPRS